MLSEKQKRFADYFVQLGNATEAYVKAGYKEKGANANAARLIANDSIQKYIQERNKSLETDRIADMEEVKLFWTKTMRNGENEMKDRLKASEYIAKTNAAFITKQEIDFNKLSEHEADELIKKYINEV